MVTVALTAAVFRQVQKICDGTANVSPEEQAEKDQFVGNAFTVIYDKKTLPLVLQRLRGVGMNRRHGSDPIEGLAQTTVLIVGQLQDSAQRAGKTITSDILLHGGKEILEELADMAGNAGIHDYAEAEIEGAFYRAMDLYRAERPVDDEAWKRATNLGHRYSLRRRRWWWPPASRLATRRASG